MGKPVAIPIVIFVLLILLGCQQSQTRTSQSIPISPLAPSTAHPLQDSIITTEGNQDSVSKLLLRALAWQYDFRYERTTRLQVLPGKLPEGWRLELPFPEKTSIIGTILAEGGNGPQTQLFLDVSEPIEAVEDAYRTSFTDQGLREIIFSLRTSTVPSRDWRSLSFCQKDIDLVVFVQKIEQQMTHVSLSLATFWSSPCITPDFSYRAPLPARLEPPPGRTFGNNVSGSEELGSIYSDLTLETTLSQQEIMNYYTRQLVANGWEPVESGSTESATWSVWQYIDQRDQSWSCIIQIFSTPLSPTSHSITIRADRLPNQ